MKKLSTLIAGLLLGAEIFAQNPLGLKYSQLITAEDARQKLSIIASDAFEGRETGKPGATMAANYIAGQFKKMGLLPPVNGSYFFNVPLLESSFQVNSFTVNGVAFANQKDFYTSKYLVDTAIANRVISAKEIVYIGHKIGGDGLNELGNTNIAGKIIFLVNEGENYQNTLKRIAFFQTKKPALILQTSTEATAVLKNGRRTNSAPGLGVKPDKPLVLDAPVINISTDVANQLIAGIGETFDTFKASGNDGGLQPNQNIAADISVTYSTTCTPVKAVDVLGFLPGTDLKDQVLVFSAHYDHLGLTKTGADKVYNGADDDGSGTTGILEIANAFTQAQKEGHGPRRSILFLSNVGEEEGLLGSKYYTDHPVFSLQNTITDLNIDMIGRIGFDYIGKPDSANYVYAIGTSMLSTDLHKITESVNSTYTKLVLDYKYDDPNDPNRFYYRSDHYNFAKHGVPIIFYFNGVHADYHKATDEVSKINFPLLAKRAQLVFFTGWELANRNDRPVVDGKN